MGNNNVKDYPPYLDYPKPRKPTTNADRIRAMTDEELAGWLSIYCCGDKTYDTNCETLGSCEACWLEWLKQEAMTNG